jgi:hypothetical protein
VSPSGYAAAIRAGFDRAGVPYREARGPKCGRSTSAPSGAAPSSSDGWISDADTKHAHNNLGLPARTARRRGGSKEGSAR